MNKFLVAIPLLILLAVSAMAAIHGSIIGGGGCTNSLDFSQTCNTVYFMVGMK